MVAATGTKEQKRAAKAMPPRVEVTPPGCVVVIVAYVGFWVFVYWATSSLFWLAMAAPGVFVIIRTLVNQLRGLVLLARSRRVFESRSIRCLVIYSESPTWEEYIREKWLSPLGKRAVTLNWSDRSSWSPTLEVRLFKHFVESTSGNFNPAVLVFRGLRKPRVYRFYYAFQEAKHGRPRYLEAMETELFGELGV